MKLDDNSIVGRKKAIICGIILAKLGKKKPQNYEVFAENDVWIATEHDLTPFTTHRLEDIKLS